MPNPLLEQLNNPDPAQRRKAIVSIANSKDSAMLKPLGAIYRTDPDPQVRELALKAGKYIQSVQQAESAPQPEPAPNNAYTPPDSGPASSGPDLYGTAYSGSHPAGSGASASFFSTAPAGAGASGGSYDPGGGNMFGSYSGAPASMPIPTTRAASGEKMVTIIDVLIDLALYAVIIVVAVTAFFMVGSRVFFAEFKDDVLESMNSSSTTSDPYSSDPYATSTPSSTSMITEAEYDSLLNISVAASLLAGLSLAISSCVSIVFDCVGIHIAATSILGGKGGMVDFMHKYIPFMTYAILIGAIVLVLGLVMMTVSAAFGSLLMMALAGGAIIWVIWSMWLVGHSYELNALYGCISIFIGVILAGVISSIFSFMFSSVSALPF